MKIRAIVIFLFCEAEGLKLDFPVPCLFWNPNNAEVKMKLKT